jgi:uncharacterized protein YbjT (DUF2867 family)
MILVVGSTGMVGMEVCRILSDQKIPFKALVRSASDQTKVEALKNLGAQIVTGDVRQPDTLEAACHGVDKVITTLSSMPFSYQPGENNIEKVDKQGLITLIDIAKEMGVKHFIYTSISKNINSGFPLEFAKRAVESHLKQSGMIYTILRPSYFMEVWLSPAVGFDSSAHKAQIYGTGDQPISWISFKDVAKFIVEAVTNPAACDSIIELGGLEALTPHQVIMLFEEKIGAKFEVSHVPVEALQGQQSTVEDPMQKSFTGLMINYAFGDPIPMDQTLLTYPLRMITLKQFIAG